jgi:glutaredoxin 3
LRKNFTATGNVDGRIYSSIFAARVLLSISIGRPWSAIATYRFLDRAWAPWRRKLKLVPDDKPKLTLYNASWCWYCERVREKLDQLGLKYELIEVPVRHSERTEVTRISGQSSVPVLVDGDTVLDDDDVIIPYLERTYGDERTADH